MDLRLWRQRHAGRFAIVLILLAFVTCGYAFYRDSNGQDLGSSYVGSRLLILHEGDHLFSHDSDVFAEVGEDEDSVWKPAAEQGGFHSFLHPYVQTPLWGYLLMPLCRRVDFATFNRIFCLLAMACFAGLIWLTARYWTPSLFRPLPIAIICVCLLLSMPFQYAMYLTQTHVLFVYLSVLALIAEQKEQQWSAGLLLACAAAVKVTPGLLALYWLVRGRWKAALSCALFSALFFVAAEAAAGPALWHEYLETLHRISRVVLLSQNSQSFATVVMQHRYPKIEVQFIDVHPLPEFVRLLASACVIVFTCTGGWIDRRWQGQTRQRLQAPVGAMIAMVAATVFAPIAWTHYSIVLLMPLMILWDQNRRLLHSGVLWAIAVAVALLNYKPLATDILNNKIAPYSIVRGHFYACILALVALVLLDYIRRTRMQASTA